MDMKPYAAKEVKDPKESPILEYGTSQDSIVVMFRGGATYTYTNESAGKENIEQMKVLAASGTGLLSFIRRYVKDKFASGTRRVV